MDVRFLSLTLFVLTMGLQIPVFAEMSGKDLVEKLSANPLSPIDFDKQPNLLVVKTSFDLPTRLNELREQFKTQGTDAVAQSIATDMQDPAKVAAWKELTQSTEVTVLNVNVHPNEKSAVQWMNRRFERMGLHNLKLEAAFDANLDDPTALHENKIKGKKWLRYLAGPGVAMAATALNLPEFSGQNPGDYMLLMLPAAGVGVTTVLLELQFAWPYLNNKFWKHVWTFGGRVMGRVTNTTVNFLYGMALYGAGVGAAHIPVLFGGTPVPFEHMPFVEAATAAAIGGLTFHIAMGQFQTDISTEETRGSIRGETRYSLETTGVVVNNSARVLDWVVPAGFGAWAQAGFFMLKTLPQLIKTNFETNYADESVRRILQPENTQSQTWIQRARHTCADFLADLHLVNLPVQRK